MKIGILVSALHSLVDYDWQFVPIFLNFWVIAGFLLSFKQKKNVSKLQPFYILLSIFSLIIFLYGILMATSEILFLKALQVKGEGQDGAWKYFRLSFKVFPFHPQRIQGIAKYFYKLGENTAALSFAKKSLDLEKTSWETDSFIIYNWQNIILIRRKTKTRQKHS